MVSSMTAGNIHRSVLGRQGRDQRARDAEPGKQGQGEKKAQGVNVAMRKVDELDEPIHHGIAQGDEGQIRARGEAVDHLLAEDFKCCHGRAAFRMPPSACAAVLTCTAWRR